MKRNLLGRLLALSAELRLERPLTDGMLLGLWFLDKDGRPRSDVLYALGMVPTDEGWQDIDGQLYAADCGWQTIGKLNFIELEQWRANLLIQAVDKEAIVYMPLFSEIAALRLENPKEPFDNLLVEAPNLRLMLRPDSDHRGELDAMLGQ
jgi:hypothetical protein